MYVSIEISYLLPWQAFLCVSICILPLDIFLMISHIEFVLHMGKFMVNWSAHNLLPNPKINLSISHEILVMYMAIHTIVKAVYIVGLLTPSFRQIILEYSVLI